MASPTVDALNRDIEDLRLRATEFRGRISAEVEEYRQKLNEQAGELDESVKKLEETRDKLRDAEEAVDKLPVRREL